MCSLPVGNHRDRADLMPDNFRYTRCLRNWKGSRVWITKKKKNHSRRGAYRDKRTSPTPPRSIVMNNDPLIPMGHNSVPPYLRLSLIN